MKTIDVAYTSTIGRSIMKKRTNFYLTSVRRRKGL